MNKCQDKKEERYGESKQHSVHFLLTPLYTQINHWHVDQDHLILAAFRTTAVLERQGKKVRNGQSSEEDLGKWLIHSQCIVCLSWAKLPIFLVWSATLQRIKWENSFIALPPQLWIWSKLDTFGLASRVSERVATGWCFIWGHIHIHFVTPDIKPTYMHFSTLCRQVKGEF